MSTMRAKMVVGGISGNATSQNLIFNAVAKYDGYPADGSDEDNSFAMWTPMARLDMTVNNPELIGKFAMGDKFYVDFTPADANLNTSPDSAAQMPEIELSVFEYALGQKVRIPALNIDGVINGRVEYLNGAPTYNIKFGEPGNENNMWVDSQFLSPVLDVTERQIADEVAKADIQMAEDRG